MLLQVGLRCWLVGMGEWTLKWQKRFNVNNCKVMHIETNNPNFTYIGTSAGSSRSRKGPGVVVDSKMKISMQCVAVLKKANFTLAIIRTATENTATIIRPYTNIWWETILGILCTVQDTVLEKGYCRAWKVAEKSNQHDWGLEQLPYGNQLKHLELFILEQRGVKGNRIKVYKIMHDTEEVDRENFFF